MHGCGHALCTSSSLAAPSDYISTSNLLLEFVEGDTLKPVPVTIINDTVFEDLEFFQAALSLTSPLIPVISVAPSLTQVNIIDNDGKVLCLN